MSEGFFLKLFYVGVDISYDGMDWSGVEWSGVERRSQVRECRW
jgi:hypothetical protein